MDADGRHVQLFVDVERNRCWTVDQSECQRREFLQLNHDAIEEIERGRRLYEHESIGRTVVALKDFLLFDVVIEPVDQFVFTATEQR